MVSGFFRQPQGAAILKHKVLEVYGHIFARKTGSRVPVVLLDGYAGPGRYDDGSPGSPELLLAAARACTTSPRARGDGPGVRCIFVEERPSYRQQLNNLLRDRSDVRFEVLPGPIEKCLVDLVSGAGGQALLVFLDPFGLAIPFDMLVNTVLRQRHTRQGWQPTEVLLNFSINGVNRAAGRLDSQSPSPQAAVTRANLTRLRELTDFLGGDWWEPIWRSERPDRVECILTGYLDRIRRAAPGWQSLVVPVRDRWDGPLAYYLVLLTKHKQGLWFFADAVSYGAKALHDFTIQTQGQLQLAPPDELERWVTQIEHNLEGLLSVHPRGFNLADQVPAIYGATLGMAGKAHIRRAVERLRTRGRLQTIPQLTARVELHKVWVRPAGSAD